MHPFPHRYAVVANAGSGADVRVESAGLPALTTTVPPEFDGPEGQWSPETLLVAAVADCYVLTFRGIANRFKLPWTALSCEVVGTLDRVERVTKFVEFNVHAQLRIPIGGSVDEARRLLVRAEETCLITRSLCGQTHLRTSVELVTPVAA